MAAAIEEEVAGKAEGGIPIGAVLVCTEAKSSRGAGISVFNGIAQFCTRK